MNTGITEKKVYCIGLGGVGVSAVAKLLLARGVQVSGSEPNMTAMIESVVKSGAVYHAEEKVEDITADIDLVVTTDDRPKDHPQLLAAQHLGIPIENFSKTLGRLMREQAIRICIAGTNGKSTTSALAGILLTEAENDPTVFVGSRVIEFQGNLRLGKSNIFIAEADEYHDHFLNYRPTIAVLTNIEDDHLDYFGTHEKMVESFAKYIALLPADGTLVANADDEIVMQLAKSCGRVVTFGFSENADLRATNMQQSSGEQSWECVWKGKSLGRFTLHLPGEFNIMNTLAAMAAALVSGADTATFQKTIAAFHGVWRRFQILTPSAPITIVSDYAHHPTAVRVTLEGAKSFYPGRRIIAVFQPHHRSRLTSLFDDFTTCFAAADVAYIVETYSVPGRDVPEAESKTSQQLVAAIVSKNINATYIANVNNVRQDLQKVLHPGDVVIIMGAGNIWHTAEQLAKTYGQ